MKDILDIMEDKAEIEDKNLIVRGICKYMDKYIVTVLIYEIINGINDKIREYKRYKGLYYKKRYEEEKKKGREHHKLDEKIIYDIKCYRMIKENDSEIIQIFNTSWIHEINTL